jgi:hypothetical protein
VRVLEKVTGKSAGLRAEDWLRAIESGGRAPPAEEARLTR